MEIVQSNSSVKRKKPRSKHLHERNKRRKLEAQESGVDNAAAFRLSRREPEVLSTFEQYYQLQGFLADEWGPMIAALRRPLPVTFRVSIVFEKQPAVEECLSRGEALLYPSKAILDERGRSIPAPKKLDWCNGWQLGCDKFTLKRSYSPEIQNLRSWLTDYSSVGVLTRQEVVSMIPAALLDPQPHHTLLDLCASPGSKTTQALESLLSQGPHPSGVVVANDVDPRRAAHLVRRCKALGPACANLMVTCHPGQGVPNTFWPGKSRRQLASSSDDLECQLEGRYPAGIFDRIICDVPCSGDGTLRKIPEVWKSWHPDYGVKLHSLQLQIAMRGAALLRVGGLMCYSTCTFNPIEDEAVVAEILTRCRGSLELVDASDWLPELTWRQGVSKWIVINDALKSYPTFESSQAKDVPAVERSHYRRSMWPAAEDGPQHPLHRCLRLMPHYQDTGGFFVALLRKVGPLPGPPVRAPVPDEVQNECVRDDQEDVGAKTKKKKKTGGLERTSGPSDNPHGSKVHKNLNIGYVPVPESAMQEVCSLLGLEGEEFERDIRPRLYTRSTFSRNVSYVSDSIRSYCLTSPGAERLHQVYAGVPLFSTDSRTQSYRLLQEGAPMLLQYIHKQWLPVSAKDFQALLARPGYPIGLNNLSEKGAASARALCPGPCIIVLDVKGKFLKLVGNSATRRRTIDKCIWVSAQRLEPDSIVIHFAKSRGREHAMKAASRALRARIQNAETSIKGGPD